MAAQKKTTAKKTTAKKTPAKTTARTSAKKTTAKSAGRGRATAQKPLTAETVRQKNQVRSVILFACAIFLGCLILIEGDNLWSWAHNAILGIFGSWAILAPVLIIYIAIVTAMNRPRTSVGAKMWLMILVMILFCTTGFIFSEERIPENLNFFTYTSYLYTHNAGIGGGVVGGYLGKPLMLAAGETGAKIIIILLLFVSLMILTGTTLIQLFKTIKRPVDVVADGIQKSKDRKEEERQLLESEIDIALSDELPAHPVQSDVKTIFKVPEKKGKPVKEPNEKLDKLKEVFGFHDKPQDKQAAEEKQAKQKPENALQKEMEEIESIQFPSISSRTVKTNTVETEVQPEIRTEKSMDKEPVMDNDPDIQLAKEAEKAAADFIKKRDDAEKKEMTAGQAELYNNASEYKETYCYPPITMLEESKKVSPVVETEELQTNGRVLVETLKSFGVQTKILDICRGPAVTRYELQPAAGVKISKITNLADDLAMNLAATGVRIEAPIPGKAAVGIEVPNKAKNIVRMRELVESNSFAMAKSKLTVVLGRDIAGQVTVADLGKMPHLLIAGTTGSGKSVCINTLVMSTLYKASPDEVRFLMIDPKVVELGIYNGIPHLLVPVVTDPRKAAGALGWAVTEMLKRYKMFAENNVRDLESYNQLAFSRDYKDENDQPMPKMPQIVIIIDELSDLMMAAPNEVEDAICRLAQMARAAGMHLVVATQRPSVDVVTGLIKANIPSRIAFAVSSAVDSRTILDSGGAEKLLGQGDMLFAPVGASKPLRIQGCYVSDGEIESIVEFVKKSKAIDYDEKVIEEIEKNAVAEAKTGESKAADESSDPMLDEAIKCVVEAGQASTSLLQRRLRLGYARAGRLVDEMEQLGIVGPHEGSKPRQVLMTYAQWLERNMQKPDDTPHDEA